MRSATGIAAATEAADNHRPMLTVREIRISDAKGIFRVMYVAKFEEAIYVLHCFSKKTQATSMQGKDIATARYRAVVSDRKGKR